MEYDLNFIAHVISNFIAISNDIANNCSYKPMADKKVCHFQRYIQKLVENVWGFFLSLTSECFCIM